MKLDYLHLRPEQSPPQFEPRPFRAIVVIDTTVRAAWRNKISSWLVEAGCLYMMAWGIDCSTWDDSVDWAVIEAFSFEDAPDDRDVMTTWHEKQPLSDAFYFAGHWADHPSVELDETIIIHIAEDAQRSSLLQAYHDSQTSSEDD